MDEKKLNITELVSLQVLQKQKEGKQLSANSLLEKVVNAKVAYELALAEYTVIAEQVVALDVEIQSYV